jgi:SAM-dependent methyltransferase
MVKNLSDEERYRYYEKSVQSADFDVHFFKNQYQRLFNTKKNLVLREDFCGTAVVACEWAKLDSTFQSYGLDLDGRPLDYGKKHHWDFLNYSQQQRVRLLQQDVCLVPEFAAHLIVAMNFSYFIFKERSKLLNYFKSVKRSLVPKGLFILDAFGGTQCFKKHVDRVEHKSFIYYWDCSDYNPITHECMYYIHFKDKRTGKKWNEVFSYDWRMWTLMEIQDLLREAGFQSVDVMWEGEKKDGSGNGLFKTTRKAENCDSWVCYLLAYDGDQAETNR